MSSLPPSANSDAMDFPSDQAHEGSASVSSVDGREPALVCAHHQQEPASAGQARVDTYCVDNVFARIQNSKQVELRPADEQLQELEDWLKAQLARLIAEPVAEPAAAPLNHAPLAIAGVGSQFPHGGEPAQRTTTNSDDAASVAANPEPQ